MVAYSDGQSSSDSREEFISTNLDPVKEHFDSLVNNADRKFFEYFTTSNPLDADSQAFKNAVRESAKELFNISKNFKLKVHDQRLRKSGLYGFRIRCNSCNYSMICNISSKPVQDGFLLESFVQQFSSRPHSCVSIGLWNDVADILHDPLDDLFNFEDQTNVDFDDIKPIIAEQKRPADLDPTVNLPLKRNRTTSPNYSDSNSSLGVENDETAANPHQTLNNSSKLENNTLITREEVSEIISQQLQKTENHWSHHLNQINLSMTDLKQNISFLTHTIQSMVEKGVALVVSNPAPEASTRGSTPEGATPGDLAYFFVVRPSEVLDKNEWCIPGKIIGIYEDGAGRPSSRAIFLSVYSVKPFFLGVLNECDFNGLTFVRLVVLGTAPVSLDQSQIQTFKGCPAFDVVRVSARGSVSITEGGFSWAQDRFVGRVMRWYTRVEKGLPEYQGVKNAVCVFIVPFSGVGGLKGDRDFVLFLFLGFIVVWLGILTLSQLFFIVKQTC